MSFKEASQTDQDPSTGDLVIYYSEIDPFSQRVRIAIHEKHLEHEHVHINLWEPRPSWYFRINPTGKTPALKHKGKCITESLIINEYLEEAFPETHHLMPEDPYLRARVRMAVNSISCDFIPAWYDCLMCQDESQREQKKKKLIDAYKCLNYELQKSSGMFFCGESFTLADVALIPWFVRQKVIEHYRGVKIPEELDRLHQWIKDCMERTSVKKTMPPEEYLIPAYEAHAAGKWEVPKYK